MSSVQQTMFDEDNRQPRSNASYNAYFETAQDALLRVSNHGTILQSNEPFARLSLYTTTELAGQNIIDLFFQANEPDPLFPLHKKLLDQPLLSLTTPMRRKTGTEKSVGMFICAVHLSDENPDTYQFLIKKSPPPPLNALSPQTSMSEKWLKSIGALAGGIAHNFNNIMTGLFGNITLAKLEAKDRPKVLAHLQKAESSMEEAVRLTRQLLTFAKGGSPLKEHFNPEPLIRDIAGLNLAGSEIELNLTSPEDLWLIHADKKQLEQVVANIVVNARHAMAEKGKLFIKLENSHMLKDNLLTIAKGAYIKIIFRDQGCGIPEKNLNRIFDPYYTTRQDSCGMGLSICYSIISRHNGHISVASQIGQGTMISIYLPAQAHSYTREQSSLHPGKSPEPRVRILVMDDEKPARDITRKILEKSGYEVSLARQGEQAVEMYTRALKQGTPFDLAIMAHAVADGMGGKTAAAKILEIAPSARLALTTECPWASDVFNHSSLGLKGIISKPYNLEQLTKAVREMLP